MLFSTTVMSCLKLFSFDKCLGNNQLSKKTWSIIYWSLNCLNLGTFLNVLYINTRLSFKYLKILDALFMPVYFLRVFQSFFEILEFFITFDSKWQKNDRKYLSKYNNSHETYDTHCYIKVCYILQLSSFLCHTYLPILPRSQPVLSTYFSFENYFIWNKKYFLSKNPGFFSVLQKAFCFLRKLYHCSAEK